MNRSLARRLWYFRLSTNVKWSKLFFGQHRPGLALTDLLMLEAFVLGYIIAARDVDRAAWQAFIPLGGVGRLRGPVERGNCPA